MLTWCISVSKSPLLACTHTSHPKLRSQEHVLLLPAFHDPVCLLIALTAVASPPVTASVSQVDHCNPCTDTQQAQRGITHSKEQNDSALQHHFWSMYCSMSLCLQHDMVFSYIFAPETLHERRTSREGEVPYFHWQHLVSAACADREFRDCAPSESCSS